MDNVYKKSPIFIIGSPRSGTTLLRLLLTCHNSIVVPPEGGFVVWLYSKYKKFDINTDINEFVDDVLNCKKMEFWKLDKNGLIEYLKVHCPSNYADAVSCIYFYYGLTHDYKCTRWGDKNNFYIHYIRELHQLFPDAYFIHIIRDVRNVVCSYLRINKEKYDSKYAPNFPKDIEKISQLWKNDIDNIHEQSKVIKDGNFIEIRLRDLLTNTVHELTNLCKSIGEEFDPNMLNYYLVNRKNKLIPDGLAEWKKMNFEPISCEKLDEYKTFLTSSQITTIESFTNDVLQKYNFK